MAQGSPVETFGCWKAKRPGEIREPVAWRGGGEKEGRGARRMDSPVSHSLADRERITMRSLPLLVSLLVLLSDRPFAHPFPSLSLSSRPSLSACPSDRLFVCLLSLSSPASPDASLASGIHLLSCPVPCPPPPLLLLFSPSFSLPPNHSSPFLYLILPFNSKWIEIVIEICNLREEGKALCIKRDAWTGIICIPVSRARGRYPGRGRREGRGKGSAEGCWKRAELGVHRWSALGPLLGSGPIPTDPRMPFTSRGPPVVVFLVLVVDAVILAILSSSSSSLREGERIVHGRAEGCGWKGRGLLQAERDNGQWGHKSA